MPTTGCLGDQSAALVGQKAFTPGMAKNTYGTGCFLLYNIGDRPVISMYGLLTTVAYDFEGGPPIYALEGSIAVAGSSVKFLVNNFRFVDSSEKISQLAATVEDSGGCTFVTAFSGLFAPYWIDDARGTICKYYSETIAISIYHFNYKSSYCSGSDYKHQQHIPDQFDSELTQLSSMHTI